MQKHDGIDILYQSGKYYRLGHYNILGQYFNENPITINYFNESYRKRVSYDILGRICHLLADMSVPAHVHNDAHSPLSQGGTDSYEEWVKSNYKDYTYVDAYNQGGILFDVLDMNFPIRYLFYVTNQYADFFPSDGDWNGKYIGDKNYSIYFTRNNKTDYYPILEKIYSNLGNPPTNINLRNQGNHLMPFIIRSTASLLLLFADLTDQIPNNSSPAELSITISGPTSLNSGQSGTYIAHPSGGSGTYTDYEWWERKDDLEPYSVGGGIGIDAPPSNQWVYLTGGSDKQQITISRTYNFSLKCVVTDSYNDQATSNILSVHVSGGALAKQSSEQTPAVAIQVPKKVELNGNFPNPFNPTTTIKFGLPEDGYVQLTIYSMSGQKVRTLLDGQVSKGYHQVIWDGTNDSGQAVSGGKTTNKRILKKMLLVK